MVLKNIYIHKLSIGSNKFLYPAGLLKLRQYINDLCFLYRSQNSILFCFLIFILNYGGAGWHNVRILMTSLYILISLNDVNLMLCN